MIVPQLRIVTVSPTDQPQAVRSINQFARTFFQLIEAD
jgi:hypothetical protein